MTSRGTLRRISSKVEAERSNERFQVFVCPRACWQKNASRREVRGVHNRSGGLSWSVELAGPFALFRANYSACQWMATTFFPVYQHARPAARRFIALRGMPFFVAPSNTRYRRHFYLKFRPPPPRLIAAGTKKRTPRIRNYYYKFIFFSFQFFHFWKNSSIIETKTRIFEFPSSRRRIFKFLKKIRIPSRLKISIKLRLFFTLIELLQYIRS